jgi:hypothetical protein
LAGAWYAIFERNGEIFLMASATGRLGPIDVGRFSMPKQVRWVETEGFAEIEYQDDHPPSTVVLE